VFSPNEILSAAQPERVENGTAESKKSFVAPRKENKVM
jgi:hypothetical protein